MSESFEDKVKVLVFGKNGQVGSQLVCQLSVLRGIEVEGADIEEIDLTKVQEIKDFIQARSPDWVINGSAHTAVDRAESEQELSQVLNEKAPAAMAAACASMGSRFIHYSTDYVFDGCSTVEYTESDAPNPQSVYGRTKLDGENSVLSELPDSIIFRTAWVYAREGNNFVNTMLRLAKEKSELTIVDDQFGSPTYANDLAEVTISVLTGIEAKKHELRGGIYHATGGGETSWFEFCKSIMAGAGINDVQLRPISTEAYLHSQSRMPSKGPVATRPMNSVLSNRKLSDTYQQELPHWGDALSRCLKSE